MKGYESIDKKVDKIFRERSKENSSKKNHNIKNYRSEREKITKQIMKLQAEKNINN
jgi:hypothetical protein